MKVYIVGDPQIGNKTQEEYMQNKIKSMQLYEKEIKANKDVVLIAGDLTETGENGTLLNKIWIYLTSCFINKHCPNELDKFIHDVYNPLYQLFEGRIYLCHGNHDTIAFPEKPVFNFICNKHGSLEYCVNLNDKVVLINLGVCYTKSKKTKLNKWLKENKGCKFIIMQHYYYEGDPRWDWWKPEDKKDFMLQIKPFIKDIICVVEGHIHQSRSYKINDVLFMNGAGFYHRCINTNEQ